MSEVRRLNQTEPTNSRILNEVRIFEVDLNKTPNGLMHWLPMLQIIEINLHGEERWTSDHSSGSEIEVFGGAEIQRATNFTRFEHLLSILLEGLGCLKNSCRSAIPSCVLCVSW